MEESPGASTYTKAIGKRGMLWAGEILFPKEGPTNWLLNRKWSGLKWYIQVTFTGWEGCTYVFTKSHIHTYTITKTIHEKEDDVFKREEGR